MVCACVAATVKPAAFRVAWRRLRASIGEQPLTVRPIGKQELLTETPVPEMELCCCNQLSLFD